MAKPFDATLKQLIDRYCGDWAGFVCEQAGLPANVTAKPLDADLSSVSPQSDKLFRVGEPAGGLIHLELQASWAGELPGQLQLYNTLAEYRYGGPVRSLLLLLRPEADSPEVTGILTRRDEAGEYLRFRYRTIRLWQLPSDPLMNGPPGLIPLALLTDDAGHHLPELLRRVDERLQTADLPTGGHAEVLTACHILLGLRYDKFTIQNLFRELRTMRESSTYQAILEEGRVEGERRGEQRGEQRGRTEGELIGLRKAILRAGKKRFGNPPQAFADQLDQVADEDRLNDLLDRTWTANGWNDLLPTP